MPRSWSSTQMTHLRRIPGMDRRRWPRRSPGLRLRDSRAPLKRTSLSQLRASASAAIFVPGRNQAVDRVPVQRHFAHTKTRSSLVHRRSSTTIPAHAHLEPRARQLVPRRIPAERPRDRLVACHRPELDPSTTPSPNPCDALVHVDVHAEAADRPFEERRRDTVELPRHEARRHLDACASARRQHGARGLEAEQSPLTAARWAPAGYLRIPSRSSIVRYTKRPF